MTTYSELIETFMHLQAPLSTNQTVRFEAIVAAVFGTKQRRFGPMPSPEIQVNYIKGSTSAAESAIQLWLVEQRRHSEEAQE